MHTSQPPTPRPRPRFAQWLWEREIQFRDAAAHCGCSHEHVRKICAPFDDPLWRPPAPKVLQNIIAWTAGEITAEDFYPPHLKAAPAAEAAELAP